MPEKTLLVVATIFLHSFSFFVPTFTKLKNLFYREL